MLLIWGIKPVKRRFTMKIRNLTISITAEEFWESLEYFSKHKKVIGVSSDH